MPSISGFLFLTSLLFALSLMMTNDTNSFMLATNTVFLLQDCCSQAINPDRYRQPDSNSHRLSPCHTQGIRSLSFRFTSLCVTVGLINCVNIVKRQRNLRAARWQMAQSGVLINTQLKQLVKLWRLACRLVKNVAICSHTQPSAHVYARIRAYARSLRLN